MYYTLPMKGQWESHKMSGSHFCIPRNETVQPPFFQNRIMMSCLPIPTFIYLWEIYMFSGSVWLICCSQICGPILGIYKSLTDTWMWKLWLGEAAQFPEKEHINWDFAVYCTSHLTAGIDIRVESRLATRAVEMLGGPELLHLPVVAGRQNRGRALIRPLRRRRPSSCRRFCPAQCLDLLALPRSTPSCCGYWRSFTTSTVDSATFVGSCSLQASTVNGRQSTNSCNLFPAPWRRRTVALSAFRLAVLVVVRIILAVVLAVGATVLETVVLILQRILEVFL